MSEELKPYDGTEREFLHDLCNPLAISYGNMRLLTAKLDADINAIDPQIVLEKLHKAIKSFDKANELLDRRRTYLKSLEAA